VTIRRNSLVHKTLLAVVVRILGGVELVEKRRLGLLLDTLASGGGGRVALGNTVAVTSNTRRSSSEARAGVVVVASSGSGQTRARVMVTSGGSGQTRARVMVTSGGSGQTRARVVVTSGGSGQTRARVVVTSGGRVVVVIPGGTGTGTSDGITAGVARVVTSSSTSKTASDGTRVAGAVGRNTANRAGLALETVVAFLTAGKDTTLSLELLKGDSGECRGGVVLGGVVVDLVDGDGGVDDVRLDGLLVHNGLDGLVDVVVDVLASNGRGDGLGVTLGTLDTLIAELGSLSLEALGDLAVVAVLKLAVLDSSDVVVVLLGENLTVLDGLDRGVVMVLVNLLVNGGGDVLVTLPVDGLVGDCRGDLLVDSSVVVTRLGHEVLDCVLCGFHFDLCVIRV